MRMLILLSLFISIQTFATDLDGSTESIVTRVASYNEYGAGDVVFWIANPTAKCHGYWITKGDPGFSANLSMVIAALQAKTHVMVHAHSSDAERWKGSNTGHFCKLYSLDLRG